MRAAVCSSFAEPLHLEELRLRPPLEDEVVVRIAACAVCHSDVAFIEGAWGGALPAVYGHEAAGIVARVGKAVSGLSEGDRVVVTLVRSCGSCRRCREHRPALCESPPDHRPPVLSDHNGNPVNQAMRTGAFAERVTVHRSQIVPLGEHAARIAPQAASLLACGVLTGVGAVRNTAGVVPGSSVVVIGVGGVGLNCVQGAKLSGAEHIVAVDIARQKLAVAASFGATEVVDASEADALEAVIELTRGRGADYVFVAAANPALIERGAAMLGRAGTLVIVGMPPSGSLVRLEPVAISDGSQRILGAKMGDSDPSRDLPHLAELYSSGELKLRELMSGTFSLEEINDAVTSARSGEQLRGVIVFEDAVKAWG